MGIGLNALYPIFLGDFMTVNELIAKYNDDRQNTETPENLMLRIRQLEEIVLSDVILTHENDIEEPEHYFDEWGVTSQLLIPVPYIDVYINYIDMYVQQKLNQMARYNNASAMFNNTYIAYQQWYNRNHKPLHKKNWVLHRGI